jgi:hypothetical protein
MTEPLLMALVAAAVWFTIRAVQSDHAADVRRAGLALAAACLTRYEAWPVTIALLVLACAARLAARHPLRSVARRAGRLAWYPAAAVLGFAALSRATIGEWFVKSGFFVPDNYAMHQPVRAIVSVWWGVHELAGYPLTVLAAVGLALLLADAVRRRERAAWILPLALAGAGALPWYAFYSGHPFRIRYMVVLVPVVGLGVGYLVGLAGRARLAAAALVVAALATGPRPFSASPMVLEAQWDREHRLGRMQVSAYLQRHWNGQPIMGSMGSLAHYMQELSQEGFALDDFVHEGVGQLFPETLSSPRRHVRWILAEEEAEGGDMLTWRGRQEPSFLEGFARVCEGGGVALYKREPSAGARGPHAEGR